MLTLTAAGASIAEMNGLRRARELASMPRTASSSSTRRSGALAARPGGVCARYHASSAPPGSLTGSSASTQSLTALTRFGDTPRAEKSWTSAR